MSTPHPIARGQSERGRHRLGAFQAAVFAALVIGTFVAFFAAQRLKHSPAVIQQLRSSHFVSPNGDGRLDAAHIGFLVDHRSRVAVEIRDLTGGLVATPLMRSWVLGYRRVHVAWLARKAADGRYHAIVVLNGNRITLPRTIVVDTAPPSVSVVRSTSVGDVGKYRLTTGGHKRRWALFVRRSGHWTLSGRWHPMPYGAVWIDPGIYDLPSGRQLLVAQARDTAGNIGYSVGWDRHHERPDNSAITNLRR